MRLVDPPCMIWWFREETELCLPPELIILSLITPSLLSKLAFFLILLVAAGDTVILRPPDPSTPNYVARIELIEVDSAEKVTLKVRWYYRPEESAGGRRQFHGSKELFLSDHYDFCSPDAIENKCTVHTFKEYTRLDDVRAEDYFCRFDYFATAGTFSPDRVAV